jgi:hypothetical protein
MITITPTPSPLHNLLHQDPTFGWDPWLGSVAPEDAQAALVQEILTSKVYYAEDTIGQDINLLTSGQAMYCSYVPPSIYAGWLGLVSWASVHAPHAFLLSITIAAARARCGDFQPGAILNSQFKSWYDSNAIKDDVSPPWGYTNIANMAALIAEADGRNFIKFSAHYGFGWHICGPKTCGYPVQCHWTQCFDVGPNGQNFDRSVGTFLPILKPANASGIANFTGSINCDTGKGTIRGLAGSFKTGTDKKLWRQMISLGNNDGEWSIDPEPFGK